MAAALISTSRNCKRVINSLTDIMNLGRIYMIVLYHFAVVKVNYYYSANRVVIILN